MALALPRGFRAGAARCGLKNRRRDVGVLLADAGTRAAGVFTTNEVRAACVEISRAVLPDLRALVVNSGNANCLTGERGERDARRTQTLAAERLGVPAERVAVASTGIIGVPLDMVKLENGVAAATAEMREDADGFLEAILTTDLVEKWARSSRTDGEWAFSTPTSGAVAKGEATILGVAKGSGMIAPNMATMFAFVLTDLDLGGLDLDALWRRVCARTFNVLTVDSDTSTNDMALLIASGASAVRVEEEEAECEIGRVAESLARQIARDGEGATKTVEVTVRAPVEARRIARAIADSPLVKTAMFGCDPNWGRVMMAAGKAGVPFDPALAELRMGRPGAEIVVFARGEPAGFDPASVSAALKHEEVSLRLDLGGEDEARVIGCDLGYGYVRINAEYHT